MAGSITKTSYTVPCASHFRDAIMALADKKGVNVADLARSAVLLIPGPLLETIPDPGEPDKGDRETIILKSGASAGRPWRRKPRLQVRMQGGIKVSTIRKALALILALEEEKAGLGISYNGTELMTPEQSRLKQEEEAARAEKYGWMKAAVEALSFDPLKNGVHSRPDALYILGFPPGRTPDRKTVRARFRELATIHHPDSETGNHQRMAQLNAAMEILTRGGA